MLSGHCSSTSLFAARAPKEGAKMCKKVQKGAEKCNGSPLAPPIMADDSPKRSEPMSFRAETNRVGAQAPANSGAPDVGRLQPEIAFPENSNSCHVLSSFVISRSPMSSLSKMDRPILKLHFGSTQHCANNSPSNPTVFPRLSGLACGRFSSKRLAH